MRIFSKSVVLVFASLSIVACSQSICPDGSAGTCEDQSSVAADAGVAQTCDDPNASICESACVDTDVNVDYCGSCDNSCESGQGCSGGTCVDVCDPGLVNCGGNCIDPFTNSTFCGASGACSVDTAGENCGTNACTGGVCAAQQRYVGSLPVTTGRWDFGDTPGLTGAEQACRTLYAAPTATVCSFTDLLAAQGNNELINATDNNGTAVTSWYILDPQQNNLARQCIKTDGENIPWTYQTADLGQGARFVSLNSAAGTVSQVTDAPSTGDTEGCRALRSVPCCLP